MISAPAARYTSSLKFAASPAPDCTATLKPSLTSFSTTSGTVATPFSPRRRFPWHTYDLRHGSPLLDCRSRGRGPEWRQSTFATRAAFDLNHIGQAPPAASGLSRMDLLCRVPIRAWPCLLRHLENCIEFLAYFSIQRDHRHVLRQHVVIGFPHEIRQPEVLLKTLEHPVEKIVGSLDIRTPGRRSAQRREGA